MPRPVAVPFRLALALAPWLVACSGGAVAGAGGEGGSGGSTPLPAEVPPVLPAGVYEVRVELAYGEADSPWSAPLPEAAEARLVVAEPRLGGQELFWFASDDVGWGPWAGIVAPESFLLEQEPGGGDVSFEFLAARGEPTCDPAVRFRATGVRLVPRDADGDGVAETIDGTLGGLASELIPGAESRGSRGFSGRVLAVPDLAPPAAVPAGPVPPWGPYLVRFSEPVFFEEAEFALVTDAGTVPVETGWASLPNDSSAPQVRDWDRPLEKLDLFVPGSTSAALPPGAEIRLERLRVRDLAGNVLDASPWDSGTSVVAPEGRPVPSFEDGALSGWITSGGVAAVRSSPTLPALDGYWLVAGSLRRGFKMAALIDVPDTEAPAFELEIDAPFDDPDRMLVVRVGEGNEFRQWGPRLRPTEGPSRFDLPTTLRGRTATLIIELGLEACNVGRDGTVVLDSFRVLP